MLGCEVVHAPSEVGTDGGGEDGNIKGEMDGVVPLCNILAISNSAAFADNGALFVN